MAEACGACCRTFRPSRKLNESLKCACQRPFFSQTVARNNLPTDRDCWIVVFTLMEKSRFLVQVHRANPVPLAPVKVEQDGDVQVAAAQDWLLAKARKNGGTNGELGAASLEASGGEAAIASETNDGQIPSPEVVYLRRNASVPTPVVESPPDGPSVEATTHTEDAETEEGEASSSSSTSDSDWSLTGSRREMSKKSGQNDIMDDECETSTSDDNMTEEEELRKRGLVSSLRKKTGKVVDGSVSEEAQAGKRGKRSPHLYVAPRRDFAHHWATPGTTRRKTYVSKRAPVTRAQKEKAFEAAKACPITYNSYLRQLEKDNVYRALVLAIPAPWCRENMPQAKSSYMGTLVDEKGNAWRSRVRRTEIFWGHFALDHYLEEDDVVVMELVDSRLKSLKFLVHIFRVVDVKMTVTGKAGWAAHYDIVDGIKNNEARRQLLKGKGRLKRKRACGSAQSKTDTDLAVETSHERLARRGRRQAALHSLEEDESASADAAQRTVDSDLAVGTSHERLARLGKRQAALPSLDERLARLGRRRAALLDERLPRRGSRQAALHSLDEEEESASADAAQRTVDTDLAVETSHKRLTRRRRRQAALDSLEEESDSADAAQRTVDSEQGSEDSLPLHDIRDFNNPAGPTPSMTTRYRNILTREMKVEMMEDARDCYDSRSKFANALPRVLPRVEVKKEYLN